MPNAEQQRPLNQLLVRLEKAIDASAQMHVVAASIAVRSKGSPITLKTSAPAGFR